MLLTQLPSSHSVNIMGHTALGLQQFHEIPLPSVYGEDGPSLPGFVWHDDIVNSESVVGINPGDACVMTQYQVDEHTCIWLEEHFVAQSHIYPGLTGKVSALTHFPLEPICEDYSSLDQAVTDFEHDLASILTDSCQNTGTGFSFWWAWYHDIFNLLCLVSTISDIS